MTSGTKPYHHGDLRRALLAAAAEVIAESGTDALSLRDLARRAGVSHAAPGHHFGDRAGLMTAVAAQGFELLCESLAQAPDFADMGLRYVRFALDHPGHFAVMFRADAIHQDDPDFTTAAGRAQDLLRGGAVKAFSRTDERVSALAAWSLVHGLATLLLSGAMTLDEGQTEDDLTRLVTRWLTQRSL